MTVWNLTTMESLNFHLFEIVQQALLWINWGFKSSGTNLNLRYANNSIFWQIVYLESSTISQNSPIDKYGFQDIYQKII